MNMNIEMIGNPEIVVCCKITDKYGDIEYQQFLWTGSEEPKIGECKPILTWGYEGSKWEIVSMLKIKACLNPYYGGDTAYMSVIYD